MVMRDYGRRSRTPSKRSGDRRSFVFGTVMGLALGFAGTAAYFYYRDAVLQQGAPTAADWMPVPSPEPPRTGDETPAPPVEKLPGSDFGFYEDLPAFKMVVPGGEKTRPTVERPGARLYILQAGAFATSAAAGALERRLVGLGYRAEVDKVAGGDGADLFRVRLGPYSMARADAIRRALKAKNLEALMHEYRGD